MSHGSNPEILVIGIGNAYRLFRLRRQSYAGFEIPTLDSIDDQAFWKAAQHPRQLDSRDETEGMTRPTEGCGG